MASKDWHSRATLGALTGLVCVLAAWNVVGWVIRFAPIGWPVFLVSPAAVCCEFIAAFLAFAIDRNARHDRLKLVACVFSLLVVEAINTAGTHNAWLVMEEALQAEQRKSAAVIYEHRTAVLEATLAEIKTDIASIPTPDPNELTSRQEQTILFYRLRMEDLGPRRERAELLLAEHRAAAPMDPPPLIPHSVVFLGFLLLAVVKVTGFWAVSQTTRPVAKISNPGRELANIRHHGSAAKVRKT